MKSIRVWAQLALFVATLPAQTQIDLRTQSKSVDFSAAASTKPSQTGTVLPATCSVGATFFHTAASAGHNLFGCTTTNTWTLLGANLWFGGGNFNAGDCATFNSSGNIVSAGGACGPATSVTMASPFTAAGSLMVSAGPGRQAAASTCSNSGGILSCPGGFSGNLSWLGGSGVNTRQLLGPAGAFTNSFNYRWTDSIPTAATLMKIGTPAGGESSLGPAIPDTDYVTPSGVGTLQNKTFDGTSFLSSYLPWRQIATPSAPSAGYLRVYGKIGSGICWVNSLGVETCAGGGVNDPGGTGLFAETAPGVITNRSIAAGSSNISVTNADGTGGNPTVDIGSAVNFAGKTTSPVQTGPTSGMPTTCSAGQLYFATDGVPGRQLQTCSTTNSWVPEAYAQGMVNPAACSVGQLYFNTGAPAGQNLYFCSATNRWSQMSGTVATVFGRSGAITAQTGDYAYSQISNTPAALPPNGPAYGDLSGSYPAPVVSQVNGAVVPSSGVLKANTSRQIVTATSGTDYAPPTSGSSMLKGNGAGGFAIATAGSDYMAPTTSIGAAQMPGLTGDCITSAGSVSTNCSKTNGKAFAASATTDTTNAGNISSGTLNAGRLPATAMQTNQSNTFSGGAQDFRGAAHTMPVVAGLSAAKPGGCVVGEEYFATDATPGQNQYFCTANGIWTQGISAASVFGRTGAVTAQSGDYTYAQIANTPAALPPNGAASGDLSGSYPNPTVAQVNGAAIPTGGVLKANGSHQIVAAAAGTDFEAPLTFSGSLNRAGSTITCGAASSIAAGCLSSADWSIFSGKQNALINPITGIGSVGGLAKFTAAGALGSALAGADYAPATSGTALLRANGGGGFAAAVAGADYAPATVGTSLLKGNSGGFAAAVAGTDFAPATTGTSLLKGNNAGGFAAAAAGTDYAPATTGTGLLKANNGAFSGAVVGVDYAPSTSGTSLLKGNDVGGFAGAVAGTDYAPATTGSSLLKANNGGFVAAVAGTDYAPPTSGTTLLKGNSTGGFAVAVAGTDYAAPPVGWSLLKANNGGFVAAVAGTDYAPPTSGATLLKGNSTGGFTTAVAGTDYAAPPVGSSLLKANNGSFVAAVSGTDYAPPTSGTTLLKGNSTGGFAAAVAGTDYAAPPVGSSLLKANNGSFVAAVSGTDYAPPTSGTTLLKGNSTGGFATAVAGSDYAAPPVGSSLLKANNGSFVAAVSGTDYAPPTSGTTLLKGNSTGGFATAVAGTDYAAPPVGSSLLKANNGGFAAAVSGTDYAPPTSGTTLLKGNSTGGFATAVAGTDYAAPPAGSSLLKANNGGFAAAVAGTDYAPATPGPGLLKGNNGGFAVAVSGADYAPATSGTGLLKGNGSGGFSTASAADVVSSFSGCSGTQYLGADGACHTASGGSGYVALTTGTGAPAANCAAPSGSNLAVYLDTANGDEWWCYATNSWKKTLSVTGSGPYQVIGATGTAPVAPASGMVACYFDQSSLTQTCVNSAGGTSTTVAGTSGATANSFVTYIDSAGVPHVAQPAFPNISGTLAVAQGGTGQTTYAPTLTIATGSIATNIGSIAPGTCSAAIAATATGAIHNDSLVSQFDGDPTGTTGWSPSTSGSLYLYGWITAGQVNFKICNNSAAAIAPGTTQDTIDWAVRR